MKFKEFEISGSSEKDAVSIQKNKNVKQCADCQVITS